MKRLAILIFLLFVFFIITRQASAIYDPLSVPNNKIGVHILFPGEIDNAKELVNTNGGDWGYVTIPIQSGDKDIKKWQTFMDKSRKLHIIPIIRLATQGDYFKKTTWEKPNDTDIVDFANFLNSLDWPTKNRYIIIYNEVNRADEWQGQASPKEYARILSYSTTVFKSKNPDFFIISSGMDNASITGQGTYNQFEYFKLMNQEVPGIFNQIDGISSHSYPNPGFSEPPTVLTQKSISSFQYELIEISKFSNKKLPVFITETGWNQDIIPEETVGEYFIEALNNVWSDARIVAVTPFLLNAGSGVFQTFSLTNDTDKKNKVFEALESFPKTTGSPKLNSVKKVLGKEEINSNIPTKNFSTKKENNKGVGAKIFIKFLFFGI